MAGSLNRVELIGHLGADPEAKTTQAGGLIVRMRVATSESWRDKQTGEKREKTEWHSVVIFSEGLAKVAREYLRKGSKVYAAGQLQTRKWQDKDRNDRYSTEIVLNGFDAKLLMLDGRREGDRSGGHGGDWSAPLEGGGSGSGGGKPASGGASSFDDEIPF